MTVKSPANKPVKKTINLLLYPLTAFYRLVSNIGFTVKRVGGLSTSAQKTIRIFNQEGLEGVLKRFRRIVRTRDKGGYKVWISKYDKLTPQSRMAMRGLIKKFPAKPLISILMPTYNSKSEWLIEAIESARNQIYPNWELCIADDASTRSDIRPLLERYAREDSRIKVTFHKENRHISEASNSALKLAKGAWIALLDHDDLLSEHALFWVVKAVNENPKVRLIYSDEDKVDEKGNRRDPYFKCDWNEDLFYSHNLITHLGVYQTQLIKKIGGFRRGLEGAQGL
jgi:O-antigen biosynthesis protein